MPCYKKNDLPAKNEGLYVCIFYMVQEKVKEVILSADAVLSFLVYFQISRLARPEPSIPAILLFYLVGGGAPTWDS